MLANVERLALADTLLELITLALGDKELADKLWAIEVLDGGALETLLETVEELARVLDGEGDPEGLTLDGKP